MLLLPRAAEACPMGLAPTTSTTMMMALGDALAIALLERKGFSSTDFQLFHPGGRLGRRLLRVGDIMHAGDRGAAGAAGAPMSEAILVMTAKSFGCVGVRDDDGRLVGVITDGDLRRHMGDALLGAHGRRGHAPQPEDDPRRARSPAEALGLMNRLRHHRAVCRRRGGRPVGFLHMHDCLRAGGVRMAMPNATARGARRAASRPRWPDDRLGRPRLAPGRADRHSRRVAVLKRYCRRSGSRCCC